MCELCDDEDQIERDLNTMLSAASQGLQETHRLYQLGQIKAKHIDWVIQTRDALGCTLADYEDGDGYTTLASGFRNYATNAMRCLEEDANALHKAIVAEKQMAAA